MSKGFRVMACVDWSSVLMRASAMLGFISILVETDKLLKWLYQCIEHPVYPILPKWYYNFLKTFYLETISNLLEVVK